MLLDRKIILYNCFLFFKEKEIYFIIFWFYRFLVYISVFFGLFGGCNFLKVKYIRVFSRVNFVLGIGVFGREIKYGFVVRLFSVLEFSIFINLFVWEGVELYILIMWGLCRKFLVFLGLEDGIDL